MKPSKASHMLFSRSMPIISIAHKKIYPRFTFWGASPDMKPSRSFQRLFFWFMPIISIAYQRNLTTFQFFGSIAARHKTLHTISKAVLQVRANHKNSPQKNLTMSHILGSIAAGHETLQSISMFFFSGPNP